MKEFLTVLRGEMKVFDMILLENMFFEGNFSFNVSHRFVSLPGYCNEMWKQGIINYVQAREMYEINLFCFFFDISKVKKKGKLFENMTFFNKYLMIYLVKL